MKQEAPYVNIERSIIKEYRKTIWRPFVKGLQEYEMIQDGDRGKGLHAACQVPAAVKAPE